MPPDGKSSHRLAPWSRIAIGLCVIGIVGVGLVPPYEILDPSRELPDGSLQRAGTERKFVLSDTPVGRGIWRLDLWRLCIEEGVLLACTAGLSVAGRRKDEEAAA